ncbi:hypothetical protein B0J14DRAFT_706677 [Halenospora varia]|nr:hypothetical protein B0J14DRAFT_706677 [Halenospora varia]
MEEIRKILYQKAARELPDFPKNLDDLYVAILPYSKIVQTCAWEDFLWLKARGKNTIGQIQDAHIKRTGTKVLLVHGEERLANNTQLRRIHNNYNDLVVFWTIVDTRAVLSQDVRPQIWELAQKMDVYWETGVFPGTSNTVANDQSQSSVGVHRPMASQDASPGTQVEEITFTRAVVDDILKKLRAERPKAKLVLKASQSQTAYFIECFDCINVAYKMTSVKQAQKVQVRLSAHLKDPAHILLERGRTGETQSQVRLTSAIRSQMIDSPPGSLGDRRGRVSGDLSSSKLPRDMRVDYITVGSIMNRVCRVTCEICHSWSYEVKISSSEEAFAAAQWHASDTPHQIRLEETLEELRNLEKPGDHSMLLFLRRDYPKADLWIKNYSSLQNIDLRCMDCGSAVCTLANNRDRHNASIAVRGHMRRFHPYEVEEGVSIPTSGTTVSGQRGLKSLSPKDASGSPFSQLRGVRDRTSHSTTGLFRKLTEAKSYASPSSEVSILTSVIHPVVKTATTETPRTALDPIATSYTNIPYTNLKFRTDLAILRAKYPLDNFIAKVTKLFEPDSDPDSDSDIISKRTSASYDTWNMKGAVRHIYMRCHDCSRDIHAEQGRWLLELESHLASEDHRLASIKKIESDKALAAKRKKNHEKQDEKAKPDEVDIKARLREQSNFIKETTAMHKKLKRTAPEDRGGRVLKTKFR